MRKGIEGPAALAQDQLRQKPTSSAMFAFRGRRGDRLKLLYWDGQGFCLYYKILDRGRFPWPGNSEGTTRLISAQLAMLWEGIDWRRPDWARHRRVSGDPESVVFLAVRADLYYQNACRTCPHICRMTLRF